MDFINTNAIKKNLFFPQDIYMYKVNTTHVNFIRVSFYVNRIKKNRNADSSLE